MISIIVPIYNQKPKILKKCLDSIAQQTDKDFEVIVIDDGSDKEVPISSDNVESPRWNRGNFKFPIKVIRQEHGGANAARNRGFRESKGEFLLFCDSDVEMREDCLEKMLQSLKSNSDASYAYSSFKYSWKKFKLWPFDAEKLKKMPYIHTTSLIRREHFPGFSAQGGPASGWDENIKRLQDWDLFLTMAEQGRCGVWISKILFKVHPGGLMSKWLPKIFYKIPWLSSVKKYKEAMEIIKNKHHLN